MTFDTNLFFLLNNLAGQSYTLDFLIIFFAKYLAYLSVGMFLIVAYRAQNRRSIFLMPLAAALIARLGITELIRFFIHRPRPFMAYHVHQLLPESAWSFPSGHATFFFALATGLYFANKKWGLTFFSVAMLITTARVMAGLHYPSDIIAGMFIGMATAYLAKYWFTCRMKE